MDQEDMINTSKMLSIQHYYCNHRNTIDGSHGSGSHSNEDNKVFKKHRESNQQKKTSKITSSMCEILVD